MTFDVYISDATSITEIFDHDVSTLRFNFLDAEKSMHFAEVARANGYLFVMIPSEDYEG